MWDTLGCGGETQALIYNPKTKKVIGVNALGVAPTGATPAFYRSKGYKYPPEFGPLAAVTPGTMGGLMTMLAEWGRMSLKDVLTPAIQMADGYAIESQVVRRSRKVDHVEVFAAVFLPNAGDVPEPGLSQRSAATLRKPWAPGSRRSRRGRRQAGDLRRVRPLLQGRHREGVRARCEDGGLFTLEISRTGR